MANATRGSWWTRWPDPDTGPLWVGAHLNERGGELVIVGVEIWTEPPGAGRASMGPLGDAVDDLLPWPAVPVRDMDLSIHLDRLTEALRADLSASNGPGVVREATAILRQRRRGRPRIYSDDHFSRVAGAYLRAVDTGSRSPTLDVARTWGVSRSAASGWVMQARSLGLIPPAPRAGMG